ncbi:hypothetical protein K0T92_10630 [Paenibacillus oenotherae]|uniref:Uncharacterized protein n=1 Tax=Paenibacillus oenotherae TaxID=1435645 RepID=A0ABS7D5L2_9BACL|nr:hypothetical protein [Paenibacillus oenotherae]MBW7475203.1 hypothetical protein [Paenibacillus oenotherae]
MKFNRENYQLTGLELFYLASLVGGVRVPGVEIDLEANSDLKLRSMMDAQQRSLEKRGYLEVDFDGIARMNPVLRQFITLASQCEAYFCQYNQIRDEAIQRAYYFSQGTTHFEMTYDSEQDMFIVQQMYGLHELLFQVIDRFPLIESSLGTSMELKGKELHEWTEEMLQGGAIHSSISRIDWLNEEIAITKEYSLLLTKDQTWKLDNHSLNESCLVSTITFETAMDELAAWIKETVG